MTATRNCGILTELSQEYILNIQFKQLKKLKKLLTGNGKCDKVNKLSEGHKLRNIRKRLGCRKAVWLAVQGKALEKTSSKKLKKCLTRPGRCDKVNELSERQEP